MKKILLVNASRYFFNEGKNLLDRKDFQVFIASSAMQALQIHRKEHVNLVVSDLYMPEMGGDELCRKIREESESRLVSFILIYQNNPEEFARATNCGANISLHKPFTAKTLLEHVEKLLTISVRKGYRVLLRAKVKSSKDDAVFFCTSQNISATGILIETDRTLLAGEEINCAFYLPGSTHITADGEVVRMANSGGGGKHHHYGIRFTAISAADSREIERFVAESVLNT